MIKEEKTIDQEHKNNMKVIYDSYRRHRNNSSGKNGINNNNNHKNGHHAIEICHPNDFLNNSNHSQSGSNSVESPGDLEQLSSRPSTWRHIISVDSLLINKELGIGEFGVVQQGVWTNEEGQRIQVAIKCLSSARLENSRIEFLKEATIMHSISHEHIVTLYGVVLEPSVMLITELAPLRSLLECLKEPQLISHFPLTSLCTFAAQIADGMSYLESKRLIHRDLAARNILVFSKTKVKISDFGLSRALGVGKDYYQSNFNVNLKLPIAWCAPECINYLKFTSQSDVWAYGVTLWEMFSFGFQPWAALTGQQILEAIDKPNFQRLEKPECCPKEYYQLMLKCWTHEPHLRPKFSEIVLLLPDCKPELLQAIRNSDSMIRKDILIYKSGDIVTVIDKNNDLIDGSKELLWKGVTNDRKTGLFNPSDFVAYLGQNLPSSNNHSSNSFVQSILSGSNSNGSHSSLASTITSTVLQSSKFLRGFLESKSQPNNNHSPHGNRKNRLRPEMISRPQGDLKHTGHVGADGVFFGDLSFLEGQPVSNLNNTSDAIDSNKSRKLTISNPITNFNRNSSSSMNDKVIYSNCNHEYHEISDEEDVAPLESPPFEVLDFGPSLMEEVFRELDHIKPDLNNEAGESETAINENSINVKNEVRELNLKISKETNNLKKKQSSVKPISEAEQNELDSAIAMARTMMLDDDLNITKNDSPKTPNSPNKKKFSFKFPTHRSPKSERRTFSEETESIGNIIESITPAAKEAYMSLVDKGVSSTCPLDPSQIELNPPSPPNNANPINSFNTNFSANNPNLLNEMDNNPLRMLRTAGIGKVLRPKVRGNRSFSQPRLPTTAQTAGLARVASSRSPIGLPTNVLNGEDQSTMPIQNSQQQINTIGNNNALPLPPRDRSRPLIQLKTHQRRHPLIIPVELASATTTNTNTVDSSLLNNINAGVGHLGKNVEDVHFESSAAKHDSPPIIHRHVPVLKQVSCPQAPAAFLSVYNNKTNNNNKNNSSKTASSNDLESDKLIAPCPPPKPNRTYLSDDLTESIENEIQKAFDNIKMNSSQYFSNTPDCNPKDETSIQNKNNSSVSTLPSTFINVSQKTPNVNLNNNTPKTEIINLDTQTKKTGNMDSSLIYNSNSNNSMVSDVTKHFTNNSPSLINNDSNPPITNNTSAKHRNIDSDEVRVMQKVLTNEINLTAEECAKILDSTNWDIHRAIKCIRLRQQLRSHNINIDCDWAEMLSKFNWNIRQASNYLIATQGVPEDTTEV